MRIFVVGSLYNGTRRKSSFLLSCFPRLPWTPSYRVHKLVHQPPGDLRLADDPLLVVLAYGATELVIVHSGPVLPDAP